MSTKQVTIEGVRVYAPGHAGKTLNVPHIEDFDDVDAIDVKRSTVTFDSSGSAVVHPGLAGALVTAYRNQVFISDFEADREVTVVVDDEDGEEE